MIKAIVGSTAPHTDAERIRTLWNAIKWRFAALPGFDAIVLSDGRVWVYRV